MKGWESWRNSRIRYLVLATFVAGILVCVLATIHAKVQAQGRAAKKSDAVVKVQVAPRPVDGGGNQWIVLTLVIEPGWHIYANPAGPENLASAQTTVSVTNAESVQVVYPKGRLVQDKVVGNYWIYNPQAEIKALVKRVAGSSQPLDVNVRFQACCHKPGQETCLLPATVTVKVP